MEGGSLEKEVWIMPLKDFIDSYIDNCLAQGVPITPPRGMLKIISVRACILCGKPYTINIPYENCQQGLRDLCDGCIIGGKKCQ